LRSLRNVGRAFSPGTPAGPEGPAHTDGNEFRYVLSEA
jgi:hypothetical protein